MRKPRCQNIEGNSKCYLLSQLPIHPVVAKNSWNQAGGLDVTSQGPSRFNSNSQDCLLSEGQSFSTYYKVNMKHGLIQTIKKWFILENEVKIESKFVPLINVS